MTSMDAPRRGSQGLTNLLRRLDDDLRAVDGPMNTYTVLALDWVDDPDPARDLARRAYRAICQDAADRIAIREAERVSTTNAAERSG